MYLSNRFDSTNIPFVQTASRQGIEGSYTGLNLLLLKVMFKISNRVPISRLIKTLNTYESKFWKFLTFRKIFFTLSVNVLRQSCLQSTRGNNHANTRRSHYGNLREVSGRHGVFVLIRVNNSVFSNKTY